MPHLRTWTLRALFATLSGFLLMILMPTPAAMMSDGSGAFPGTKFVYTFGVVERNGVFWSVENMSNAYFTELNANPFATRAQAEAWRDRSRRLMESILQKGGGQPGSRIEDAFVLPAWERATTAALQPYDGPMPSKGSDLPWASCRGVGVPMHYACWIATETPSSAGPRSRTHQGTFRWFPLPHATLIYWPGFLINMLVWSAVSLGLWWLGRTLLRRLRKKKPQSPAAA